MFRRSPSLKILTFAFIGFILHKFITFSLFGLISFVVHISILAISISLIFRSKLPIFFIFGLLFGIITSMRTQHLDYKNQISCNNMHNGYFYGNVTKVIRIKPKYSRIIVQGKILNDEWNLIKNTRFLLTILNSKAWKLSKIDDNDILTGAIQFSKPQKPNLPNEFNELNYLRNMECEFSALSLSNKLGLISINRPPKLSEQIRNYLFTRIEELFSPSTSGIVKAILLGDKTDINRDMRQDFAVTGVAHILAVSGFHVGVISGILFWLFSFIRNEYLKFFLLSIFLSAYIYLVDFQPSAVRAGIMILLFLFALLLQRKPNPINIIATTILLVAVFNPSSLYSIGFQMSIAAISGIFLLHPTFRNSITTFFKLDKSDFTKKIGSNLAVSLAASVIVSPIVAFYFGLYSIISPLANLIVIPIMLIGQVFGIVALVSSFIFLPLGHIFANISQISIEIAIIITHFAAELPFSHLSGELVISVSIISSICVIYLLFSNSSQKLLFRFLVVLIFVSLISLKQFTQAKTNIKVYERLHSYLIENNVKNIRIIIGKKDCKQNWDDYGLLNYLKSEKKKVLLYNISNKMRYNLFKNKVMYKKINEIQELKQYISY